MYLRLIATRPDRPSGVYFDYLEVYSVARAILSDNCLLGEELNDFRDEPQLKVLGAGVQSIASTPSLRSIGFTRRSVTGGARGEQTPATGLMSICVPHSL
jgi:hypothetical protein